METTTIRLRNSSVPGYQPRLGLEFALAIGDSATYPYAVELRRLVRLSLC